MSELHQLSLKYTQSSVPATAFISLAFPHLQNMTQRQTVWIRNQCCHSYNTSFDRFEQLPVVLDYLCSSRHHTEPLNCRGCCLASQRGRRASSLHSRGEAKSPGSGRCRRTATPERNCPGQPSTPDTAAPLWPAAPQGTRSGLRLRTETICLELRNERPHLQNRKQHTFTGSLIITLF